MDKVEELRCDWCGRVVSPNEIAETAKQDVFDFAAGSHEKADGQVICKDCLAKAKWVCIPVQAEGRGF